MQRDASFRPPFPGISDPDALLDGPTLLWAARPVNAAFNPTTYRPGVPCGPGDRAPLLPSLLLFAAGVSGAVGLLVVSGRLALVTWPLAVSAWQLSVTPLFTRLGVYRYHSDFLKATVRTRRVYEVHGATSWDWLRLFRLGDRGAPAARRVLAGTLEGLLDVAGRVASGEIPPGVEVTGTSFFFGADTARRLGFSVGRAGLRLRLNLVLNVLDITLMYSFTRGRPAFPNLLDVKRAVIRGGDLAARREEISALLGRLQRGSKASRGALTRRRVSLPPASVRPSPPTPGPPSAPRLPPA